MREARRTSSESISSCLPCATFFMYSTISSYRSACSASLAMYCGRQTGRVRTAGAEARVRKRVRPERRRRRGQSDPARVGRARARRPRCCNGLQKSKRRLAARAPHARRGGYGCALGGCFVLRTTLSSTSPMTPFPAGGGTGRVSAALFGALMIRARPWSRRNQPRFAFVPFACSRQQDFRWRTRRRKGSRVSPGSAPTTARPGALS